MGFVVLDRFARHRSRPPIRFWFIGSRNRTFASKRSITLGVPKQKAEQPFATPLKT